MRLVVGVLLVVASTPCALVIRPVAPALRPSAVGLARRAPIAALTLEPPEPEHSSLPHASSIPAPRWRRWLQQRWRNVLTAATIGSASVLISGSARPPPAFAAPAPTSSSSGMKKKPKARAGNTMLPTVGLIGGISYLAYASSRAEDKLESKRIKVETEKLDQLAKEFTDIDDQVTVDADLMASLKKRMGKNETSADGGEGGPSDELGGGGGGDQPPPPAPSGSGGSSAVLEPPSSNGDGAPAPEAAAPPSLASEEEVERMKRMFGGSDDAK
jgi:hypothetical protein